MIWHLPSPAMAQKYRVDVLYEGEAQGGGSPVQGLPPCPPVQGLPPCPPLLGRVPGPLLPAATAWAMHGRTLPYSTLLRILRPAFWGARCRLCRLPYRPKLPAPPAPAGPLDDAYATAIRNCDPDGPLMM